MSGFTPEKSGQSGPTANQVLHRAAWVLPMTSPPIPDGGVLVSGAEILAVGSFDDLRKLRPSGTVIREYPAVAFLPGLVNAHTHLELSPLAGRIRLPQPNFPSWLSELLSLKARDAVDMKPKNRRTLLKNLVATGTVLAGDVSNGSRLHREPALPGNTPCQPYTHLFHEVLGFDRLSLDEGPGAQDTALFRQRAATDEFLSLGAHSVYSTSGDIIESAKAWCRGHGRPFTIHCAEHLEEVEFLLHGTGFCRRLLEDLGRWIPGWKSPGVGPVRYLHGLGILDEKTILVHAVHLNSEDWRLVARTGAGVCFCPRSNANLGVGRPHMATALAAGITCGLGTDSLASNEDLSLFSEAVFTLENFKDVPQQKLMEMITINGAVLLGKAHRVGSLQAGRSSAFLAVTVPQSTCQSTRLSHLMETILYQGKEGAWQWVSPLPGH